MSHYRPSDESDLRLKFSDNDSGADGDVIIIAPEPCTDTVEYPYTLIAIT